MKWKLLHHVWLSATPWTMQSMEFSRPEYWSSLSLVQGIFPTQESNPGLQHCRRSLYWLSHKGSPRIWEWVAYPFPSRSSQPRNQTKVSYIAGRSFASWATRETPGYSVQFSSVQSVSHVQLFATPWTAGRKWRTKEPLDESERGEWKSWLKAQHSEN